MVDVSIIITNYNYRQYLSRAIRSCIGQSLPDNLYEIIVVDDASTDNSANTINRFPQVRTLLLPKRSGLGTALNRGLEIVRGQYVVRLDADDYFGEDLLLVERRVLRDNPQFSAVACDYHRILVNGQVVSREFFSVNPIGCGVMFRTDVLLDIGGYKDGLETGEDAELRTRYPGKICTIPIPLYRYNIHSGSLSNG
ncbi:MAG: glycosyltransferase family 2 protein [Planctomycetota bacterium]